MGLGAQEQAQLADCKRAFLPLGDRLLRQRVRGLAARPRGVTYQKERSDSHIKRERENERESQASLRERERERARAHLLLLESELREKEIRDLNFFLSGARATAGRALRL